LLLGAGETFLIGSHDIVEYGKPPHSHARSGDILCGGHVLLVGYLILRVSSFRISDAGNTGEVLINEVAIEET
jgi:hypothetical protein